MGWREKRLAGKTQPADANPHTLSRSEGLDPKPRTPSRKLKHKLGGRGPYLSRIRANCRRCCSPSEKICEKSTLLCRPPTLPSRGTRVVNDWPTEVENKPRARVVNDWSSANTARTIHNIHVARGGWKNGLADTDQEIQVPKNKSHESYDNSQDLESSAKQKIQATIW
jgi:hypothetical protein